MRPDRVLAKQEAEEKHRREIAGRIRQLLSRRGQSVEEVGRNLEKLDPPVTGGDRRQLRRLLSGEVKPNVHLLARLARILDCSPGWLLAGVGHPDVVSLPFPDYENLGIEGLDGVPEAVRRRLMNLAWLIAVKQTDSAYDMALKVWGEICSDLAKWIREPCPGKYFEQPVSDIGWINYASKVLEGLESLTLGRVDIR